MKKILIANRGEIALRVIRTCNDMGIKTVAVFSEADRLSPHVKYADEAVCIGKPPSSQSYLLQDKIIETVKNTSADGIHPGYGFLSENPEFAERVEKNGIIFIGPSSKSMNIMGNKLSAKAAVAKFNVPLVPGSESAVSDMTEALEIAKKTGFPVLIKASAGGGGKGMRIVKNEKEFKSQMERATSEAKSAFGDGSVFIEKYVSSPRHIEIQILADTQGNIVHVFERECSIQRRHQKLIEEAPSSILTSSLRKKMGECAVNVAKSCNYTGAGTVEFLLDEKMNFYFLEMNTRLQVEHPVTELITGIDLVKEQIEIARGKKLSFTQNDIKINGHAIELRICAEDPSENFLPSTGTLHTYKPPLGPGVRIDDGYEEGMDIPIFYDPLIAKLITWGENRQHSIERMKRAIREYHISGIATTLPFGFFVMNNKNFQAGSFDTHFIEQYFDPRFLQNHNNDEAMIAAFLGSLIHKEMKTKPSKDLIFSSKSNWKKNRIDY